MNATWDLTYTSRLNDYISTEDAPSKLAPGVNTSTTGYKQSVFASNAGVPVMKSNWQSLSNIRYQYFASEDGFTRYYPAFQWDEEEAFDGRLESWYANAVSGPKTTVLLIRKGYDYGDALIPFLSTFSDKDFLQIVAYGLDDYEVSDCFETVPLQMFRTESRLKSVLWDFIDDMADKKYQREAANLTNALGAGFDTVVEMFNNPTAVTCLPAIVWLPPPEDKSDNDLRLYTGDRNEELEEISRQAAIYIYEDEYNEFSHRITCESSAEYYNYGNNETDLGYRLSRYYLIVGQSVRADTSSALFVDSAQFSYGYATFITSTFRPDGKDILDGLSLTLVQGAYSGRTLIGCVGIDIDMTALEGRLLAERKGTSGVYVLSNQQADTIVHPAVSPVSEQSVEKLLDIANVEITPAFYNVRTGIVQSTTSNRQITVIQASDEAQGASVPSTYFWAPLPTVPMTVMMSRIIGEEFSLLLEPLDRLIDGNTRYLVSSFIPFLNASETNGLTFMYSPELDAMVTYDAVTYIVPPSLYQDLDAPENLDEDMANSIHAYLNSKDGSTNDFLGMDVKPNTRVLSTSELQALWMNHTSNIALSRAFIFTDGVGTMYPGRSGLSPTLDWRNSAWYECSTFFIDYPVSREAASNPKLSLTPPVVDSDGVPFSVALSSPVFHDGSEGLVAVGVMSMEMRFTAFWEGLTASLPAGSQCRRSQTDPVFGSVPFCILMDNRGYVVGDAETYDNAINRVANSECFLGYHHPAITQFLFENNILVLEDRVDYKARTQGHRYFVNDNVLETGFRGELDSDCASSSDVDVHRIPDTSFFLITVSSDYSDSCDPIFEPDTTSYEIDVCADISFTYRAFIGTENCQYPLLFVDSVLDTVREAYAQCEDIGKYFIIHWIEYDDPLGIAFIAITAMFQILILGLMLWVALHKNSPVIRMASPLFCELILFGCVFALCTVYFLTGEPSTNICRARAWFFCLGFSLTFAALFAKTWRLHKIYLSALDFQNRPISPAQLLGIMVIAMAPTVILLILWSIIDPLEPEPITDDSNSDKLILQCQSDNQWVWQGCLIAVNGILVLYGCYVSIITRKIRLMFNESRYIGLAIYNVAVFATVGIALGAGLENNLEAWYAILCGTINGGTILVVIVLFLSKLKIHYFNPEKNTLDSNQMHSLGTGTGGTQAFHSESLE